MALMISLNEIAQTLKSNQKYWIVFTGDSITSCEWVHPNWRNILIYVLQTETTKVLKGDWKTSEWGIKGFNFAYDGATTEDILNKMNDIVLVKPDLTIGLMGGNDPIFNISVASHIGNIEKITSELITAGSKVAWCTSIPPVGDEKRKLKYMPYAKACMQISQSKNLQLVDLFNLYKKFPLEKFFTFKSEENPEEGIKAGEQDIWHPNQLGNAYIAKVILKEVFSINFDPEKYIKETLAGEKYPSY